MIEYEYQCMDQFSPNQKMVVNFIDFKERLNNPNDQRNGPGSMDLNRSKSMPKTRSLIYISQVTPN